MLNQEANADNNIEIQKLIYWSLMIATHHKDGHQIVMGRPVLGVALAWLANPAKLLACGGTNWTQVILVMYMKVIFMKIYDQVHFPGDHRMLLVVTSPTSQVEKRAQFENKPSIWSLGGIRGRSLHGRYLVPVQTRTRTTLHRLVGLTDVLTRLPFVKLQPLSVLDCVAGKRKSSWIQVIANRLLTYGLISGRKLGGAIFQRT